MAVRNKPEKTRKIFPRSLPEELRLELSFLRRRLIGVGFWVGEGVIFVVERPAILPEDLVGVGLLDGEFGEFWELGVDEK